MRARALNFPGSELRPLPRRLPFGQHGVEGISGGLVSVLLESGAHFLILLWALPHSAFLKPQASSVLPQPPLCVLPLGLKCGVPPSAQGLEGGFHPPTA